MGLAGKRVADVPELAKWRLASRFNWKRLAELNLVATIINVGAMDGNSGWMHFASSVSFGVSFSGMFFAEFRARRMTRQLQRRAAEQLWRDVNGYHHG